MSVNSPEHGTTVSALDVLRNLESLEALTPGMVQDAINQLVGGGEDALSDAEWIAGWAELGLERNPDDPAWGAIHERAQKIYKRERTKL